MYSSETICCIEVLFICVVKITKLFIVDFLYVFDICCSMFVCVWCLCCRALHYIASGKALVAAHHFIVPGKS
jgi:flagellar biosynthesis component FlhA